MSGKFYKNEKFQQIFVVTLYLLLTFSIIGSGCYVFHSLYYTKIYVSGSSMMPTLYGDKDFYCYYGISDNHERALKNLNRFDVVVTYYGEEDSTFKIKRVWGFPGETIDLYKLEDKYHFTVSKNNTTIFSITAKIEMKQFKVYNGSSTPQDVTWEVAKFDTEYRSFYTHVGNGGNRSISSYTLANNEYYVMGDNWANSSDSYGGAHITFKDLQGKVVSMQGYCHVVNKELVDKHKFKKKLYYF